MAFTAWQGHAFFYKNARSVYQCDDAEGLRPRFRSERRESGLPEFAQWQEWDGDLRAARGALMAAEQGGHAQPLRVAQPGGACKLCGAPIALGTCEFDHVVPVSTAFRGQIQEFQALCHECHRLKTGLENSHATALKKPLQPHGVRGLRELAAAAAAGLRAAEVERGPGLLGRGRGALPQERARQRALPAAGVLSLGFGAGGAGGPPGRPDLRQAAEGRPRGAACQAAIRGRRLVRQAGVRPHAGGRRRDVAGLPLEPGRHGARGPELPRLGAVQDGGGLARTAPGQAERQCLDRAVGAQRGPGLPDAHLEQPARWPRLPVPADLRGRGREHLLGPRLRGAALQQRLAPARVGLRDGGGVLRGGPDQAAAGGGAHALPEVPQDRLPGPPGSAQEVLAGGGAARRRHAGLQVRAGRAAAGQLPGAGDPGLPPQPRGWEQACRAAACCSPGCPAPGRRTSRGASWSAQTADHWVRRTVRNGRCQLDWLVVEEVTQIDSGLWADVACVALDRGVRFLLLGDFRQLPAVLDSFAGARVERPLKDSDLLRDLAGGCCHELTENRRSDERIFRFIGWLRVGEPEEVPLAEAVRVARREFPRPAGQHPDVCLVLSHADRVQINERESRRLAPADAVVIEHQAPGPTTNAPQRMRVWPGLRLVGAGGKVAKGTFVRVAEKDAQRVALDGGQQFSHAELLRHTRLCHAITYASCQGLMLRGRVWLLDAGTQHFNLRGRQPGD